MFRSAISLAEKLRIMARTHLGLEEIQKYFSGYFMNLNETFHFVFRTGSRGNQRFKKQMAVRFLCIVIPGKVNQRVI